MAEEQSPTVEIAPTVVISNSEEPNNGQDNNSNNEPTHADGDGLPPASEQVAIAAIEAERDVTLAAIHSDVERERIALETERVEAITESNKEIDECREELARLTGIVEQLTATVNSLIPPPQLVVEEIMEELPIAQEPDLIQPSTPAPTVETRMEHLEESAEERAEEVTNRARRFIAI